MYRRSPRRCGSSMAKERRPALAGLQISCVARPSTLRACTQDAPHISCHISRATYLVPHISCHVSRATFLASCIWHQVSRAMNVIPHVMQRHRLARATVEPHEGAHSPMETPNHLRNRLWSRRVSRDVEVVGCLRVHHEPLEASCLRRRLRCIGAVS